MHAEIRLLKGLFCLCPQHSINCQERWDPNEGSNVSAFLKGKVQKAFSGDAFDLAKEVETALYLPEFYL